MAIRRQHYVPQGYLKGFAAKDENSDKFIWVYEKIANRRPRKVSVKQIAYEEFYYEQETESGQRDTDSFEKSLAEIIDNNIPSIIRGIKATPEKNVTLNEDEVGTIAFFLGLSLTRVPSFRTGIQQFYTKIAKIHIDQIRKSNPTLDVEMEKWGVEPKAKNWVSLKPMILAARQIALSILEKAWQFFVPPGGCSLITSDNPVIFNSAGIPNGNIGGPGHPMTEIVMNLRHNLSLVCTPKKTGNNFHVFRMNKQEVKKFNRGIARAAKRFVFADHYSEGLQKLAVKHIGSEQAISIL